MLYSYTPPFNQSVCLIEKKITLKWYKSYIWLVGIHGHILLFFLKGDTNIVSVVASHVLFRLFRTLVNTVKLTRLSMYSYIKQNFLPNVFLALLLPNYIWDSHRSCRRFTIWLVLNYIWRWTNQTFSGWYWFPTFFLIWSASSNSDLFKCFFF